MAAKQLLFHDQAQDMIRLAGEGRLRPGESHPLGAAECGLHCQLDFDDQLNAGQCTKQTGSGQYQCQP